MFSGTFLKKYLVRVVKLMALVLICHQVFNAKLLGYFPKGQLWLYTISSMLVTCAGIFNTYLLNSSLVGSNQKLWLYFHNVKLAMAIAIFTPLIKTLSLTKIERINIQFYCVLGALVLSPMARYYRYDIVKRQLRRSQHFE